MRCRTLIALDDRREDTAGVILSRTRTALLLYKSWTSIVGVWVGEEWSVHDKSNGCGFDKPPVMQRVQLVSKIGHKI